MSKKVNVSVENGWGSITRSMVGLNSVAQIMCVKANGAYWALGRYDNMDQYRILMVTTNNNTLVCNITGTFEVEVYYHN